MFSSIDKEMTLKLGTWNLKDYYTVMYLILKDPRIQNLPTWTTEREITNSVPQYKDPNEL